MLALSLTAAAEDATPAPQTPSIFSFSGFGTIGVVQTNTDAGVYTTGTQYYGATKSADFGPDTKMGAQVDAKFNDMFSATVQVFSKQNAVGSYAPDIEWAFVKAKLGDGFDIRLGRIGAPFFMTSDFRNVGYTNTTVRTPVDVYAAVPVRYFDGGDVLYQHSFGDTILNAQLWGGSSSTLVGQDTTIWLHNIIGVNVSLDTGPVVFRIGRMQTRLNADGSGLAAFDGLLSSLSAIGAAPGLGSLGDLSSALSLDDKFATFTGIGATLDVGHWVGSAEITKRQTESWYVSDTRGWYATLGYRVSTFTPYVSLSGRNTDSPTSATAPAVPSYLPPQIQGAVPVLIGAVNGLLGDESEKTVAIGTRWDAGKNYDVKAEIQRISVPAGSSGAFSQIAGGRFASDTDVTVFSLCLDFVF